MYCVIAGCQSNFLVKSQRLDDSLAELSQAVKSFRCKAHKYEGMRRTYRYAGLAERSQAMIHPVK